MKEALTIALVITLALALIVAVFSGVGIFVAKDTCRDWEKLGFEVYNSTFSCFVKDNGYWRKVA